MDALEAEALMYPRGKHDDLLDGLYYANRKAYGAEVINLASLGVSANGNKPLELDWLIT